MARISCSLSGILGCCLLVGVLCGCRSELDPNSAIAAVNETNMQRLANLYFTYQMKHAWQGPKDEQQFKEFLKEYNPDKLTRIGIDPNAIDELFVNERDGKPFKIRYSVPGSAMGSSAPVIFESTATDGHRMVGLLNMEQIEVDEDTYELLWAGKEIAPESIEESSRRN